MAKVYIADKQTLDEVKADTGAILGNFPIDVGIPYDTLTRFLKTDSINKNLTPNEQLNLFTISGEGYLFDLNLTAIDAHFKPEIIIDGRNIVDLKTENDGSGDFNQVSAFDVGKVDSLRNSNSAGVSPILKTHGAIKFNNNLIIRATNTLNSTKNNTFYYKIEYGLV